MVSLQTIYEYNLRGSIVALQKEVVDDVVFYGDGKEKTYSGVYTYLRTGNRYLVMLSFLGTTITQAVSVKFGIGVENVIASIKD